MRSPCNDYVMLPMYNKEYQNNIVEVEAREFGGKIRKMFEDYLSVTK